MSRKLRSFLHRALRSQAYTGGVEECLLLQRGKFVANVLQCHQEAFSGSGTTAIGTLYKRKRQEHVRCD